MFPDLYTIGRVREEQAKEWFREVERYRLARLALAGRTRGASLLRRTLAALGGRMVAWGSRLQECYGTAVDMPRALESNLQPGAR